MSKKPSDQEVRTDIKTAIIVALGVIVAALIAALLKPEMFPYILPATSTPTETIPFARLSEVNIEIEITMENGSKVSEHLGSTFQIPKGENIKVETKVTNANGEPYPNKLIYEYLIPNRGITIGPVVNFYVEEQGVVSIRVIDEVTNEEVIDFFVINTIDSPIITPKPTISQTPNATQTFQAVFEEIDNQLRDYVEAAISFNTPKTMKLDEIVTIELLLNPSVSESELATQSVQRGEQRGDYSTSTAEPGKLVTNQGDEIAIITSEIQVTNRMKAELKSIDSDAFEIQASHANSEQPVSGGDTTVWRWDIKARKSGIQTLELNIYRLIKIDGTDNWREVHSYRREIEVNVSFKDRLESLERWQWITALICSLITLILTVITVALRIIDYKKKNPKRSLSRFRKKNRN
jgi:hypothetical protein